MTDYGLLVGLVAVGTIASVATTGDEVVRAFCKASNGMLQITGGEPQAWCIEDPNDRVQLAEDERFVDAPVQMQADFTDVLFANSVIGEQLVMSAFQEAPARSFWLDTELTSRDPHEADRQISSCYILNGGADPICAAPGATSAVSVPVEAKAFGYAVMLSEDTEMPWANDVEISIPASEGLEAQSWNVEVAREEAEPILDNFSIAFGPHTFAATDTGWTYGAFAPIEGKFNRPFSFYMQGATDIDRERRACYVPSEGAEPICSLPHAKHRQIEMTVAPGAVALGYEIELPAMAVGPDWVVAEKINLVQDGTTLHTETVTMTRPNEAYENGTLARSFSSPYSFAQTDTGWTEGEFIAISGPRNVNLAMEFMEWDDNSYSRKACYKTVTGGEPICGDPEYYYTAKVTVPTNAVEVGYMISLPAEAVGPDTTFRNKLTLSGGGGVFYDDILEIVRPNESYQSGEMSTGFASPYTFAQTDTGWTEGEFIELNGPRNVALTMELKRNDTNSYGRQACYKTVAGGDPICGDPQTYYTATASIPTDAVEVGYMISLPAERVGDDTVFQNHLKLVGGGATLFNGVVEMVRPSEPFATGSLDRDFVSNYRFAQTDTGWVEGEFVPVSGERNTNMSLIVNRPNDGHEVYHRACYKTVAGGAPECGSDEYYSASAISVPPEAVEIGYMLKLPAEAVGPDWESRFVVEYRHRAHLFYGNVTAVRPNEPYEIGSIDQDFSSTYTFAGSDTEWTEGEFVGISGDRNVNLTLKVNRPTSGREVYRQACYKTVVGGEPVCGPQEYWGVAMVSVPPEAVEIGYLLKLPAVWSSEWNSKFYVEYRHSQGLFSGYVNAVRPAGS